MKKEIQQEYSNLNFEEFIKTINTDFKHQNDYKINHQLNNLSNNDKDNQITKALLMFVDPDKIAVHPFKPKKEDVYNMKQLLDILQSQKTQIERFPKNIEDLKYTYAPQEKKKPQKIIRHKCQKTKTITKYIKI